MATFKSEKVTIESNATAIFDFVSNLNNLEQLMPLDKITDWHSNEKQCSFKIPTMGKIGFKHDSFTAPSQIKLASISDKPFSFSMLINIIEQENCCQTQIIVDANMNPMLKMMVSKSLTAFFNGIAQKLKGVNFND